MFAYAGIISRIIKNPCRYACVHGNSFSGHHGGCRFLDLELDDNSVRAPIYARCCRAVEETKIAVGYRRVCSTRCQRIKPYYYSTKISNEITFFAVLWNAGNHTIGSKNVGSTVINIDNADRLFRYFLSQSSVFLTAKQEKRVDSKRVPNAALIYFCPRRTLRTHSRQNADTIIHAKLYSLEIIYQNISFS